MKWLLRLVPKLGRFVPILGAYWKVIAIAAVLVVAFGSGYKVAKWRFDSTLLGAVEAAKVQAVEDAKRAGEIGAKLEVKREKAKVVYRTVYRDREVYIDRPVYRSACIDDDGLRNINRALEGEGTPAAERGGAVPAPHTAGGKDRP